MGGRDELIRKLSSAVEQSPSTVVITDTQGVIEYINPKFTALSGFTIEEISGKKPNVLKSGFLPEHIYKSLWHTISSGQEWRGELLNRKKNGDLYWEHASISPIRDETGAITHYLKVAEDVTNRKRVEEELKEAKEAAIRASEAKSAFLANMSHEIRTPMNVIIGMTELVLDTKLEAEQQEYLNMVRDSGNLLLKIINQILDFSKIEAGKLELEKMTFPFHETIMRLVKIQSVAAREKGITLDLNFDHNIPDLLEGDAIRLQQVLINLIGNAIKFTNLGGVTLQVQLVETKEDKVVIRMAVQDTGMGIATNKIDRLFESFSQVESSFTKKYEGTGLGLAISKKLVELMGGTIAVESEVGRGSVFHFTVCFALAKQQIELNPTISREVSSMINETAVNRSLRILLVEDKPMNQRLATAILQKKGWQVTTANNGLIAVEILQKELFDIILMDIQMPVMNGIEATTEIRKLEKMTNRSVTPIVAMTANAMKGEEEKYIQIGMDDYITKPFVTEELYTKIESLVLKASQDPNGEPKENVEEKAEKVEQMQVPAGLQEGYNLLGRDQQLFQEIVEIFVAEYPTDLEKMRQAIANQNAVELSEVAHGLKGELGHLRAAKAYQLASRLEKLGKESELQEASKVLEEFTRELALLEEFFSIENWIEIL
ncbi:hypothetical protein BHU72_07050 [Desulfuribacillus stibiiarsenatis]|uniref:Circadian input-output histidine kinase CikA n=1 Tax=Desulfuribacillus stibiiarsenatis TaxID=1390249 RepID=A0A1E5L488_9FIRM|nr:hybrid sensor histidine kinase/response regulator [Desulfuribacillus stibiiarsenatis]OEH84942.1 hypothetical protein BHU72_07050 [Desulfuribacillus stibiiarsenatis]